MPKRKVIISAAVTGSIHTPSMSPYLPITADEIARAAVEAAEAGASIVHLHARETEQGRPSQSVDLYEPFLKRINAESDVVVNITTGGNPLMSLEERMAPVREFQPELASLNMGSINFGMYPMLQRFTEFEHEWERPYLENSKDFVFRNTFGDIEKILAMGAETRTRFEHECYDIAHLYNLAHFVDRKLISGPLLVQSVFGILGGIGVHPEDVTHMRRTAERLFGDEHVWSVLGGGRHQIPIVTMALTMGGHIRVGLEDSLWLGPGELATSSAVQVMKARRIIQELGMEVATPDEAREVLQLKGRSKVAF